MNKWYDYAGMNQSIIISSRVRLARNIKKYPFQLVINDTDIKTVMSEVIHAIDKHTTEFEFIDINDISEQERLASFERHNISQYFLKDDRPRGFLLNKDNSLCIMLNEEDHIRIQSICPGDSIDKAFSLSDNIDNIIEENIEYAFDKDFGYLTSCPTNIGTGLRASCMLHLPMLERTSQLKNLIQIISKFGMTVRGLHGEGTEPMGSIYQVSNQITLGKPEHDIIQNLRNVVQQVIDQEMRLRERNIDLEDKIHRSYGILTHCKKISTREAMSLLSDIKLGYEMGLSVPQFKINIYNLMMNIQPGILQETYGLLSSELERDISRANYIKSVI